MRRSRAAAALTALEGVAYIAFLVIFATQFDAPAGIWGQIGHFLLGFALFVLGVGKLEAAKSEFRDCAARGAEEQHVHLATTDSIDEETLEMLRERAARRDEH